MKNLKIIDFWISTVLIVGSLIFAFAKRGGNIHYGYVIVGSWQVLSMLIHSANRWFMQKDSPRAHYNKLVFWVVTILSLLIGVGWFVEKITWTPILIASFIILYLTPFMAIFYTHMCYEETYLKMRRPMELLK